MGPSDWEQARPSPRWSRVALGLGVAAAVLAAGSAVVRGDRDLDGERLEVAEGSLPGADTGPSAGDARDGGDQPGGERLDPPGGADTRDPRRGSGPDAGAAEPGTAPSPPAVGAWRDIPEAPIPARASAAGVWTGTDGGRVVGVGVGGESRAVYAWAPDGGWQELPDVPDAVAQWDLAAVWAAGAVLVWGNDPPSGAVLRSDAEWGAVAEAPLPSRFGETVVWTGRELVVWGGSTHFPPDRPKGAALRLDLPATAPPSPTPEPARSPVGTRR